MRYHALPLLLAAPLAAQSYLTSPKGFDAVEGNAQFFNWGPTRRLQGIDNTLAPMVAVFKDLAFRRDGAGAGSAGVARTMDVWIVLGTTTWGVLSQNMDDNFTPGTAKTVFTRKSVNFPDWSQPPAAPPAAFDFAMTFDMPFLYLGVSEALVWSVSYDLSTNTSICATDRHYVAFTPNSSTGSVLGVGCRSTGQSANYVHTMAASNAGTVAGMGLTAGVTGAPAGASVVLFLDAVASNLTLPSLCGTLYALPSISVDLGAASSTGVLANKVLRFPYVPALESRTVYSQCVSPDAGQVGLPATLSNGCASVVPVTTVTSGIQAAYQWSSLPTVTSTVFYGGSVIARLGY